MPFYRDLDLSTLEGNRLLDQLLKLRTRLAEEIPRCMQRVSGNTGDFF
jgi:hypothetical protein